MLQNPNNRSLSTCSFLYNVAISRWVLSILWTFSTTTFLKILQKCTRQLTSIIHLYFEVFQIRNLLYNSPCRMEWIEVNKDLSVLKALFLPNGSYKVFLDSVNSPWTRSLNHRTKNPTTDNKNLFNEMCRAIVTVIPIMGTPLCASCANPIRTRSEISLIFPFYEANSLRKLSFSNNLVLIGFVYFSFTKSLLFKLI